MIKKRRILKMMGSLILTLAMVLTMMVSALPVYAASGGSIKVTYDPGVAGLGASTFTAYKVGHFGSGSDSGKLFLDTVYAQSGISVNINIAALPENATQDEKDAWQEDWLRAANTIGEYVNLYPNEVASTVVGSKEVSPGSTETIATVSENGLYLLVGTEQSAGDRIWRPVPVLVLVLNGDTTFKFDETNVDVKMVSKPIVHKHTIIKKWVGGETVRPESIDVDIFYGSTKVDTVTLSGANSDEWTYTWYSSEDVTANGIKVTYTSLPENAAEGAEGVTTDQLNESNHWKKTFTTDQKHSWTVAEVFDGSNINLFKFFSYEVNNNTYFIGEQVNAPNEETITITNKFGTDRIVITKKLTNFAKLKGMVNAVIGYKVTGYAMVVQEDGSVKEEVVYTNSAGMVFDRDGTQTLTIYGVPQHLSKVVVEEIYVGDYEPDESTPRVVTITEPTIVTETNPDGTTVTFKQYEAYFWNDFKDVPHLSGGIVNKYSKDPTSGVYTYEHSYTYESVPEN